MTGEMAIAVKGLTKIFGGVKVVDGLDLAIPAGKIMGFLGPNGSGKTTTLRMLCGLLTPDAGGGTCLGMDISADAHTIKRQVGYMTQKFSLYDDLSIAENLDFIARVYGLEGRRQKVAEAIERLGLGDRKRQLAGHLSGGWKQRLALAACIMHRPRMLLLDEPTAGVDPKARREFWEQIHALAANGMTVLVSTHYMDEAERCHAIAYLAYGRLLAAGTADEVIEKTGLNTFIAVPEKPSADTSALACQLAGCKGVDLAAAFGPALHVGGADRRLLLAAIAPFRKRREFKWTEGRPTLEDAFIFLMARARDNFQFPETPP